MAEAPSAVKAPDRAALRSELEATREAYRRLVEEVEVARWGERSGNAAWTRGQLLFHVTSSANYIAGMIDNLRQGRRLNPTAFTPQFILDRLNVIMTRRGARRATKESVLAAYDAAHQRLLSVLDAITDEQWQIGQNSMGVYYTLEGLLGLVPHHIEEHGPDIRKGLDGA